MELVTVVPQETAISWSPKFTPFTVLLPLFGISIWVTMVLAPTAFAYLNFQRLALGRERASIPSGDGSIEIPRSSFFSWSLQSATATNSHLIQAVNLPGVLGTVGGVPTGFLLDGWRALICPIACIPWWWFVGLGVDGALGRRRLHWTVFLGGCVILALLLVMLLGLTFGISAADRGDIIWVHAGIGIWILLFSTFPFAWLFQLRRESNR